MENGVKETHAKLLGELVVPSSSWSQSIASPFISMFRYVAKMPVKTNTSVLL